MMPNPKATIGNKMEELKMKKALYLTAAILAFAGCAKEPAATSTNGIPEGKTVNIVASLDGLKSTYNKTDGFAWRSAENISVGTSDGQYVDFSCTDAENGVFTHTFTGTAPGLLLAVSPAQNGSFTSAGNYQVTLPEEYSFERRTTNALLIGTPESSEDDNVRFEFRHAAALIRVTYQNVPEGTEGFWFETDKPITGTVTLNGTTAEEIEIKNDNTALASGKTGVGIRLAEALEDSQDMTFYIPVPTGEYGWFKMNLWGTDSNIAVTTSKYIGGNFEIARGQVIELPTVTLEDDFAPYTVGATDNTTAWWGAHSQSYQVPEGKTLHLEFYNYSSKSNNETWHNWTAVFSTVALGQDPYSEHLALRADYWGWTPAGDFNTVAGLREKGTDTNLMGDDFVNLMDGAYVTMSLKNDNGVMRFKSVSTPAAESDKAKTRTITFDMEISGDLYLFLTTDLSHFGINKVWYSGYKAEEEEDITFVGYRSGYKYYVYDTPLSLDVIGTPKRIFAWYSNGTTKELTASDFAFTAGQTLAATEGDQVFTATYKGETVNVTIPVKKGKEAFGSTTLTTDNWYDSWQPTGHDVAVGASLTTRYFVYSKCGENYHGPYAHVNDASWKGLTVFRWDNWGWNDDGSTAWDNTDANKESNWNWETMKAYQNHCLTDITWTNVGGTTATVRYDVAYWNGETHYQLYKNININGGICANAAADCCYVIVIE